jgi:hypothetical protein
VANAKDNYIYDALGDFSLGVNSGLDPFILPKNQLSFAVNATDAGNFLTNRPAFMRRTLSFATGIQDAFQKGLFQGAAYYRPEGAPEMLMAHIGGRLFAITPTPSEGDYPVVDVSITNDYNPEDLPQAWMWQSERWLIVQNGINNPIFYDGVSSRRSIGDTSTLIATTDSTSTPNTPILGGTMAFNLDANYTGPLNQAVQIVEYDSLGYVYATSNWEVVAGDPSDYVTYEITLKNNNDVPGATHLPGTKIVIQPSNLGTILTKSLEYVENEPPDPAIPVEDPTKKFYKYTQILLTITLPAAVPNYVTVGMYLTIAGFSGWKVKYIKDGGTKLILKQDDTNTKPVAPSVGDIVYVSNSSQPNVTVGVLKDTLTAPDVGQSDTVEIYNKYTGSLNSIVFVGGKQYTVTGATTSTISPNTAIILRNLNDDRTGHQFNDPAQIGTTPPYPAKLFNLPELPAGRMGAYGMGRNWMSLTDGNSFIAGDISGGSAGSPNYNYRDAVLKVSENSVLAGGGAFNVPSNLGLISGMKFTAQLDASLGQGSLMVMTPNGVFSCNAPYDRSLWSQLTSPIVSMSLIGLGGLGQNGSVVCNGDLIFRAIDGARSLVMARRDFSNGWGNTPISYEMKRVLDQDNVQGLPYVSAVQFDNHMLMTSSPYQGDQGAYCRSMVALNFDPVSSLGQKTQSVWDGMWTGLNVFQMVEGMFNGVHRCFAFTYSESDKKIELYEITKLGDEYFDNGTMPVQWSFETPMLFRDSQGKGFFDLVKLEDCEFYVSDIQPGHSVRFKVEYKPDFSSCWYPWHEFTYTACADNLSAVYGSRLGLGKPDASSCNSSNDTNPTVGRWFQLRFTIVGHCVFKGLKIAASRMPEQQFTKVICDDE